MNSVVNSTMKKVLFIWGYY